MVKWLGKSARAAVRPICVLAAAALMTVTLSANARSADIVTVSTSTETLDAFVPLLGGDAGIFAKHGIELRYVRGVGGPAMITAVVGGSADITHVAASQILLAIDKGAALTVLSGNYDIDYTFIAQKGLGIDLKQPYPAILKQLKGKTVGVAVRGGTSEGYVRKMFADASMDPDKDITMIAVGTGAAAAAAFINHQVDAMVNIPPSSSVVGPDGYDLVVNLDTTRAKVYGRNYLFTVFSANPDFVKGRPNVALNFCKAAMETIAYMKDPANAAKVVGFTAAKLNLSQAQAKEIVDVYFTGFDIKLTKDRWNEMKKFGFPVPDWTTHVFEPCANLASN